MGFICNWFKKFLGLEEEKPDWVTQSREKVADEEDYAASIHYAVMVALEEGQVLPEHYGSYQWNERWWLKHQEAAWYIRNSE